MGSTSSSVVGGDLRTVLITDAAFFGGLMILFSFWVFATRRGYLRPLLLYSVVTTFVRTALAMLLLFDAFKYERSAGKFVYWLRWIAYIVIYSMMAYTHAVAKFTRHETKRFGSVASSLFFAGAIALGPLAGTFLVAEDQRIVAISFAAVPLVVANLISWFQSKRYDFAGTVALSALSASSCLHYVFFCLGHAAWQTLTLRDETISYLVIDGVCIGLGLLYMVLNHCPCDRSKQCDDERGTSVSLTASMSL